MRYLLGFLLFAALALGLPSWQLGYFDGRGETQAFTVQKGENFALLARRLVQEGVIQNERAFRWFVKIMVPSKPLQRGEFALARGMPIPEVVQILTEGKPLEYKFTIPEGHNLFQIAELLENKGFVKKEEFLQAARSPEVIELLPTLRKGEKFPPSIEGYLFPDTYLLQKVFSPKEIAKIMVARFREVFKELAPAIESSVAAQGLGLSAHEIIILSSIVEKETGAASERPLIASVFVNRLKKRMRLQTDPTVIYGMWVASGKWEGNIRRRDLNTPNEYNTYQLPSLPLGPIANPGLNAIKAVLNPATSDYLFFVSKNNGTHIFSTNYSDHNRAVKETQLGPGAQDGKSWRDLPSDQRAK